MESDDADSQGRPKGRSRVAHLLSSYYGLGSSSKGVIDELDMDSPHFNAERYTAKVVKEQRLEEILRHDSVLVSESKELASDMQMLVYENYSKFMSSLETLHVMKDSMKTMEDQMNILTEQMARITASAEAVDRALGQKRAQVEQLAGVNLSLKKLRFLLQLPQSLKKCVEHRDYAAAVRCYTVGTGVLKKYAHLKSFQHIQDESHAVISGLIHCLENDLALPLRETSNHLKVQNCLRLLTDLEPEKSSQHRDLLYRSAETCMNEALADFRAAMAVFKSERCSAAAANALDKQLFTPPLEIATAVQQFARQLSSYSSNMDVVSRIVQPHEDEAESHKYCFLEATISSVLQTFSELFVQHINCRLFFCLERHVKARGDSLRNGRNDTSGATSAQACLEAVEQCDKDWRQCTHDLASTFESCLSRRCSDILKQKIASDLPRSVFTSVCAQLKAFSTPNGCPPLLERCHHVVMVLNLTLVLELWLQTGLTAYLLDSSVAVEVRRQLEETHHVLLLQCSSQQGQTLGSIVRSGVAASAEDCPTDVSAATRTLFDELRIFDLLCRDLLASGPSSSDNIFSSNPLMETRAGSAPWGGGGSALASEMERLLLHPSHAFAALQLRATRLEREMLVEVSLYRALRVYLEVIRTQHLTTGQLQQVQVDCSFLKRACASLLPRAQPLNGLLDDVQYSATDRSLERHLLPASAVDALVSRRLPPLRS